MLSWEGKARCYRMVLDGMRIPEGRKEVGTSREVLSASAFCLGMMTLSHTLQCHHYEVQFPEEELHLN